jgi:glyoxylase-like metal-dependent hydrolase (beta-lactamase superfamily II)
MLKRHLQFFAAIILGSFTAVAGFSSAAVSQDGPKREITNIAGDLYRFQNNFHYSVFLVTPEGVIVTDPINAEAAAWLEAEIEKRFALPIKYLVLSHDHPDHSAGGEVFADTALVVAHNNAKAAIVGEGRPTAVPNITFSDRLVLELGGKTVELIYLGPSHSDNLIVMRFPKERVLFVVDLVTVNRLPYKNLSDSYFPDWISALKGLEALDFDILAPGHGVLGTKADVVAHRGYMEKLYNEILAAARAGKTLEEMKASITMDEYKDWGQYDKWRELNIEGIYGRISLQRRGN